MIPSLRPVIGVPDSCTFWGLDAAGSWTSQTPPGQWVITRARVRSGPRVGPMVFTAIRAMRSKAGAQGIICCLPAVESQVFTPAPNTVTTVPVRMPVKNSTELVGNEQVEIVDYLGFSLLSRAGEVPAHQAPGGSANVSFIAPALRGGQQREIDGSFPGVTPLINADYEPDADGDGLGDETQDPCPTAAGAAARSGGPTAHAAQCAAPPAAPVPPPGALPTPPGAPAAPDLQPAAIAGRRSAGRSRVARSGAFRLRTRIACGGAGPDCAARTAVLLVRRGRRARLGGSTFRVAPDRTARVKAKLNRRGRRLLKRRKAVRAVVRIAVTRGAQTTRKTVRVTLRAQRRAKRAR